jgi:hypothetical protein
MKENYCGYYITSSATPNPDSGDWKPSVTVRWEEQFRVQQVVLNTSLFSRSFATDKEAEEYGRTAARKWIDCGRPILARANVL